jgi:hypothetical protein
MLNYLKAYAAVLGLVLVGAYDLLADGWQAQDGAQLAIVFLGTVGVWLFPNAEALRYAKFIAMLGIAGIGQWIVCWPDGVTVQEWISIGIAVLASAGVVAVRNTKPSPPQLA